MVDKSKPCMQNKIILYLKRWSRFLDVFSQEMISLGYQQAIHTHFQVPSMPRTGTGQNSDWQ